MDYGKILRRSWEITKTTKVLWVFGMVVAAFSGSVGSSGSGGSGGGGEEIKLPKSPPSEKLPEQTSQVLGAATNTITQVFQNTPLWVWIVLGLSILVAIGVAITISLFIRNWGKGALIASIHDVEDQKGPTLRSGSLKGLSVVGRFIKIHVIPWLLWSVFAIVLFALFIAIILAASGIQSLMVKMLVMIVSTIIWVIGLILSGILLNLSITLGEQLIIRRELSAKEAIKQGFNLTKKYLGEILGMGAINLSIGCAFSCLTMLVFGVLAVMAAVAFAVNKTAGFIVGAIVAIPILTLILLSLLIRGIYMVFNTATWTLLIREIEQRQRNDA